MLHDWGVIAAAFGYIGFLFFVASYGDRLSPTQRGRASALIYPLSLAIYCTSWTFFGSVGFASRTSVDFLAIYVGPILMIAFCTPLLRRVIRLAKSQNITSIADFIAARYGKSQAVATTVVLIAIIGSVPYIALQLKAVASSLETILSEDQAFSSIPIFGDIALMATLAMAAFAVLFGTRQTDATEHQHGLMLAVATESIVKLVAFIAAGAFVTFWMFTPVELVERAMKTPEAVRAINYTPSIGNFLTMTLLSFCAIMLLPRQFHVSVVENSSDAEVGRARWLFPLYLVAINLFVIPIALAGLVIFPFGAVDSDMYVLALPIEGNAPLLSVGVFVGGLSAATAMVIVECVALSIMVSNDIVMPLVLQRGREARGGQKDFGNFLLGVRRFAIFAIMTMAYFYYRALGHTQLAAACAGVLRRPVLATRDRARRDGRHAGRPRGMGLHAVSAELPGQQYGRPGDAAAWSSRDRDVAAASPVRRRPAATPAWRAVVALAQPFDLYRAVAGATALLDRAVAGGPVCAERADADGADVPALAQHRDGAGHSEHGGAISGSGSRPAFVRSLRDHPPCPSGPGVTGRFRTAATRRTFDRILDRGRLLAPGDVAVAAQAHRLRQGRPQAARRFPCRASFQPRDLADRAQPCAAGYRGVRRGFAADLFQPAVRRNSRIAAAPDPDRDSAARNP
jgi:Na+/proline symporter